MIQYEDLNEEQVAYLTNGCGNKFVRVPDLDFGNACRWHDFAYWRGRTKEDRYYADRHWYELMLKAISKQGWMTRIILRAAALIYYRAVRVGSGRFFYYGASYKTTMDLEIEMSVAKLKLTGSGG